MTSDDRDETPQCQCRQSCVSTLSSRDVFREQVGRTCVQEFRGRVKEKTCLSGREHPTAIGASTLPSRLRNVPIHPFVLQGSRLSLSSLTGAGRGVVGYLLSTNDLSTSFVSVYPVVSRDSCLVLSPCQVPYYGSATCRLSCPTLANDSRRVSPPPSGFESCWDRNTRHPSLRPNNFCDGLLGPVVSSSGATQVAPWPENVYSYARVEVLPSAILGRHVGIRALDG